MIYRLDFRKQDNLILDQMAKEFSKIAKLQDILDLFPDFLDLERSDIRTTNYSSNEPFLRRL